MTFLAIVALVPPGCLAQEACSDPLQNGGIYTVSDTVDAYELAVDLVNCTGGAYNVTWDGVVMLSAPLIIANQSYLTITRAQGASMAVLDGTEAAGLIELGEGSSLRLEGVSLRNGTSVAGNGGAVRAETDGCMVSAFNTTFESNSAGGLHGRGGALALGTGANVVLENCSIVGNQAQGNGGGISIVGDNASVLFTGCVIEDNHSKDDGGAIYVEGRSSVTFSGSLVSDNVANFSGGALYGTNTSVTVEAGSRFVNNIGYWFGAGISLMVSNSSVFPCLGVVVTSSVYDKPKDVVRSYGRSRRVAFLFTLFLYTACQHNNEICTVRTPIILDESRSPNRLHESVTFRESYLSLYICSP